jgi:hypothetical protein
MAAKSISELRKSRGGFEQLAKQVESQNSKGAGKQEDDRLWQCKTDTAGNGSAVIRFLPAPQGEDEAWVRLFSHGFQGPTGKWYIENSLTTLNPPGKYDIKDPVGELNNSLWATKVKANEEIARKQKRKLAYYANVYIVSDPANPENEGKVKIFRFGAKIFDKLDKAMNPEFADDPQFNPFDFWEGANFRLKITKKDGFANFDSSSLAAQKALSEDDDELQKIWDQCHSLKELVSADKFKTYEELEKRLNIVLATGAPTKTAEQSEISEDDAAFIAAQAASKARQAATPAADQFEDAPPFDADPPAQKKAAASKKAPAAVVTEEADDDLDYFRKLAEG